MKKVAALALSAGLVAGGCALMPHTGVKPTANVGVSGPVTINLTNLPEVQQMLQAISTGKNDGAVLYGAAKCIEVRVFKGETTNSGADAENGATLASTFATNPLDASKILVATASIPTTGIATITMPAIPTGDHVIAVRIYNDLTDHMSASGVDESDIKDYIVGMSESYISPTVGVPLSVTLPIYLTFKGDFIHTKGQAVASTTANSTASVGYNGLTQPTVGLYLRLANWNPSLRLVSATNMRVSIYNATAFSSTLASTSAAAGWWKLGDIQSDSGFSATQSFDTDGANGGTVDSWNWSSDKKTLYTDVTLDDIVVDNGQTLLTYSSAVAGELSSGSLSVYLPKVLVPTGSKIYFSDLASGSSSTTSSTF